MAGFFMSIRRAGWFNYYRTKEDGKTPERSVDRESFSLFQKIKYKPFTAIP